MNQMKSFGLIALSSTVALGEIVRYDLLNGLSKSLPVAVGPLAGASTRAVTESWKIAVIGSECTNLCTSTEFASYDALTTDCLSKLKHPCIVLVQEAVVPLGAPTICTSNTSAGIPLPAGLQRLAGLRISRMTPNLKYSAGQSADATCQAAGGRSISINLDTPVCTAPTIKEDITATWNVDGAGAISFTNDAISDLSEVGYQSSLMINAGDNAACALEALTADASITISGAIDIREIPGSFFMGQSSSCSPRDECNTVFATVEDLKEKCFKGFAETCELFVAGRAYGDETKTVFCNDAETPSVFVPIPEEILNLVVKQDIEQLETAIKYSSSNLANCFGVAGNQPIVASVLETQAGEHFCHNEVVTTPALDTRIQEKAVSKELNVYLPDRPSFESKLQAGFAISSGPKNNGCALAAVPSVKPSIYFSGHVRPDLFNSVSTIVAAPLLALAAIYLSFF